MKLLNVINFAGLFSGTAITLGTRRTEQRTNIFISLSGLTISIVTELLKFDFCNWGPAGHTVTPHRIHRIMSYYA